MQNNINRDLWLSRIGLGLIFCYCLLASKFYSFFAKIHLTLHFFPFPIFIGEILLFIGLVLFLMVSKDAKLFNRRSIVLLGLYFGWVLLKALINYHFDGPLTFRNAALFYYSIFAVFAYCFYRKAMVPRHWLMLLALLAAVFLFFKLAYLYCWWTYVTLYVIAVWNMKSVKWRRLGWIFLAVVFLLGEEFLYAGSRAHFMSVFGAVVFLTFYFGSLLAKRRNYTVLSILLISFLSFISGYFIFSNRNEVSSIISLKVMINRYQAYDRIYQAKQGEFVPQNLPVQLYNNANFTDFITSPSVRAQRAEIERAREQAAEAEKAREEAAEAEKTRELAVEIQRARAAEIERAREQATEAKIAKSQIVVAATTPQPKVTALVASQLVEAERARAAEIERARELAAKAERAREQAAEIKRAGEIAVEIQRARAAEIERAREQATEAKIAKSQIVVAATTPQPVATTSVASQLAETEKAKEQAAEAQKARELAAEIKRLREQALEAERAREQAAEAEKARLKSADVVPVLSDWLRTLTINDIRRSQREGRSLDLSENNIVFRLLIWRDMAREFIQGTWWVWLDGFSFGHPQRSRSLEVLHWAEGEWSRDGWITPHNSFFHIIYRAGILGIFLIGFLFFMIGRLVRDFFNLNSIEGGLLVGILIYWLVLSNFLVILEFPYNAILFWSLLGITMAYRDGLKGPAIK